ncbi:MAG: STAS domain-containing protein [Thermodesulfobacteriota bacterium]
MDKKTRTYADYGDVIVIYARDYMNDIEGEKLEEICESFLKERGCAIILDFSSTDIINSIGISILTGIIEKVRGLGTKVVLSGVHGVVLDVLKIVGLTESVSIYKTEEEALKACGVKGRVIAV